MKEKKDARDWVNPNTIATFTWPLLGIGRKVDDRMLLLFFITSDLITPAIWNWWLLAGGSVRWLFVAERKSIFDGVVATQFWLICNIYKLLFRICPWFSEELQTSLGYLRVYWLFWPWWMDFCPTIFFSCGQSCRLLVSHFEILFSMIILI